MRSVPNTIPNLQLTIEHHCSLVQPVIAGHHAPPPAQPLNGAHVLGVGCSPAPSQPPSNGIDMDEGGGGSGRAAASGVSVSASTQHTHTPMVSYDEAPTDGSHGPTWPGLGRLSREGWGRLQEATEMSVRDRLYRWSNEMKREWHVVLGRMSQLPRGEGGFRKYGIGYDDELYEWLGESTRRLEAWDGRYGGGEPVVMGADNIWRGFFQDRFGRMVVGYDTFRTRLLPSMKLWGAVGMVSRSRVNRRKEGTYFGYPSRIMEWVLGAFWREMGCRFWKDEGGVKGVCPTCGSKVEGFKWGVFEGMGGQGKYVRTKRPRRVVNEETVGSRGGKGNGSNLR